ncbi:MAG TPA: FMN-binding negative transcriptional regulator [Burkholderiaceae bacterium]|nr:FMN-binding negative transcriptional regulator [Burkholderiaceae bacterium]
MLYTPPHFNASAAQAARLIRANPLATLIGPGEEPIVTHAPLLLDDASEPWRLMGHVARANPHWQAWEQTPEVLVVFQGGDAYISPSLYSARKAVPTWNYAVVHVWGRIAVTHDSERKEQVLKALIGQHDPAYHTQWDALEPDFREGMKSGIVAFSIEMQRVDAKFKLSQNRPADDRARVLQAMEQGDEKARALAQWMKASPDTP